VVTGAGVGNRHHWASVTAGVAYTPDRRSWAAQAL